MLEYLGERALKRVGVHYPVYGSNSSFLLDQLFGVEIDGVSLPPNQWIKTAIVDTGYLELCRQVEITTEFIYMLLEGGLNELSNGYDYRQHLLDYDLENEMRQRARIVPKYLFSHGFGRPVVGNGAMHPLTGRNRDAIRQLIRERVTPSTVYELYSYGLKHRIEEVLGYYVSNGEAIEAMILEGYRYKEEKYSNNCMLNGCWIPTAPPLVAEVVPLRVPWW